MSKNTKIIAIIGGVLILVGVIYLFAGKGGVKGAMDSMGCGGKKDVAPRAQLDQKAQDFSDCQAYGYVVKRDSKGNLEKAGGMMVQAKGADYCTALWVEKCKDANYQKANAGNCAKFAKGAAGMDKDDD